MSTELHERASPTSAKAASVHGVQRGRLPGGGAIDRSCSIEFTFNGKSYSGHPGDTLASALLANEVRLVGRSFKYHRPRGIYSAGAEEPNALVTIRRGNTLEPNARATTTELFDGLDALSQNHWPTLRFDLMRLNDIVSALIPAGFYYKTFMWPNSCWRFYEHFIRRAAGMGAAGRRADAVRYEHCHDFCDVLIVGAGPTGLSAALAAGESGARVLLAESDPLPGGALWRDDHAIDGVPAEAWIRRVSAELASMPNVQVLPRTTVFGYYDHNVLGAIERVAEHVAHPAPHLPRQRLRVIRARRVILATGAIERPLVFENNDRPGVMLAGGVRTYLRRFAVRPGRRAVVFANNDDAYRTALDLADAGVAVAAMVDSRFATDGVLQERVRRLGIECIPGSAVGRVHGHTAIDAIEVHRLHSNGARVQRAPRRIECDLLAVSGGWTPTIHLHSQSGARPHFDESLSSFVPGSPRQPEISAGACAGAMSLSDCLSGGFAAGLTAVGELGFSPTSRKPPAANEEPDRPPVSLWVVPGIKGKAFVDIQTDVTSADVALAWREGYASVEHLKRYTTLGMGTDQGKTSNMNGLALMATLRGQSIARVGTTTFRPPFIPVAIGAFAGRATGRHYQPVRRTPMHEWHVARGADLTEVGLWMRPRSYPRAGETRRDAYAREAAHVRNAVGLCDISTLGKIDIQGPDAIELIERAYANDFRSLAVGRVRYGLMLREDGIAFDDGTTARLGEHHYFMTTTTANASRVLAHLEFLLQVIWPDLRARVTSVTEQWAMMVLAGPRSAEVLSRVVEGGEGSVAGIPHMGVISTCIAGIACRISRVSYSGERAYEIGAPATAGLAVWESVLEAGRRDDIQPYGTDAMGALRIEKGHVAGPELDGRTTATDLGLGALLSKRKDFIGKRLAQRPGLLDPARPQLVGLVPVDPRDALLAGAQIVESVRPRGITPMLGHVSSACYSPTRGHDIALGFVQGGRQRLGEILHAAFPLRGHTTPVRIVAPVFYDEEGARYRV